MCPDKPSMRRYRCHECGNESLPAVLDHYELKALRGGKLWDVVVENMHVLKCVNCGDLLFDNTTDGQITEAIDRLVGRTEQRRGVCNFNQRRM